MLTMLFLLNQPLSSAKAGDAERAGRRAEQLEPRDDESRRALLQQLAHGRRAPRPAHA